MSSKIQTKSASDSKAKSYEDKLLKKLANSAIDLSSDPNDFQALKSASIALGGFGMANETIEACDRAIKLNPKDDEIINTKGVAYFQLKMYDQALKCFDMTISMNKKSTAAYNNKGLVYVELGDLKRALVCFNIAISMDPQFQEAIMNRANVHSDLGNLTLTNFQINTRLLSYFGKKKEKLFLKTIV
jgi:tetratricopeptide (TPR) repeat protein